MKVNLNQGRLIWIVNLIADASVHYVDNNSSPVDNTGLTERRANYAPSCNNENEPILNLILQSTDWIVNVLCPLFLLIPL